MKKSVCMAAYHGERFIAEQLSSILPQLSPEDEVLVSDDAPGGETQKIVLEFAAKDARVRYLRGPGQGVICNFEYVLTQAEGDILFLCDQDDVWLPNKVQRVTQAIEGGACLVLHDASVTDGALRVIDKSFFEKHGSKPGFWRNFLRNSYMGCCMAFTREVADRALPFPKGIPMHDQWIGLAAEKAGRVCFLKEPLVLYRQHGGNVTGGATTLRQKLWWRLALCRALLSRCFEVQYG